LLALLEYLSGAPIMHIGWGQQLNPAMVVMIVVPVKKTQAPASSIWRTTKASWKIRAVLQGLELRFRIRIVIGNIGARMGFGHTQIGQQHRHGLGNHCRTSIRMQGQLLRSDPLPLASL